MSIGTLSWGRRSGGKLTVVESWGQILQGLSSRLKLASTSWLRSWGLASRHLPQAAWRGLELPESALAQAATNLCAESSPHFLLQHCLRSYAWAILLGQRDGLSYDTERLYLACILHDLGLVERAAPSGKTVCFAISGAEEAERFLLARSYPVREAAQVAEAIALHLNTVVPVTQGVEAHLLRQGTGLDVIGARYHHISPPARVEVLRRYPRGDFACDLARRLAAPNVRCPGSRLHLLCLCGFLGMIKKAPFQP